MRESGHVSRATEGESQAPHHRHPRGGPTAPVEEGVRARLDARDERAGVEGGLLDVPVVVLGVAVEREPADLAHRKLGPRPDLGRVKGVKSNGGRLLGRHDLREGRKGVEISQKRGRTVDGGRTHLDHHGVLGGAALLEVLKEVLLGKVGVLARLPDGLVVREALGALLAEPVVLQERGG